MQYNTIQRERGGERERGTWFVFFSASEHEGRQRQCSATAAVNANSIQKGQM